MGRVVYKRSEILKNPTSSRLLKILEAIFIFTSSFHSHLLTILTLADDHILALQNTIETYFPSTSFAFLKISNLLITAKSMPEELDESLEKFPKLMNRVVWVDWILVHVIHWLESLVNMLGRWRDKNKGKKVKEITVDRSFSRSGSMSEYEEEREKSDLSDQKRVTYKEVLQRGSSGEDGGGSSGRSSNRGDPILELFETGWIQKPIKRSGRSADSLPLSRSDSFST